MLFSLNAIKENIDKIKNLHKQVKDNTKAEDLITYKNRFYIQVYDLCLALGEAIFTFASPEDYIRKKEFITSRVAIIQESDSVEEFKGNIKAIIDEFPEDELSRYSGVSTYAFSPEADSYSELHMTHKQYNIQNTQSLRRYIDSIKLANDRNLTLFYPECSTGENIEYFNDISDKLMIYGNTAHEDQLSVAKRCMHKAVKGPLRGSRIQNNSFDIIYTQPFINHEIDMHSIFIKREEKTFISDLFKYLRADGVMVITMPFYRLYKDVCSMLSKQLKNIQVCKVEGGEFEKLGLIHIIGQKDTAKQPRPDEYAKLRRLYDYNNIESVLVTHEYTLPRTYTYIDLFKGSMLDMEEVENMIDNSSLMNKIWESQKVMKLDQNIKNPLLPFNIGQLGLVLTSGCLDGIVDEGDGHSHLIKGRVSKYTQEVEVEKDGNVEVTETTVNKVEINVLLPNGEFKILA